MGALCSSAKNEAEISGKVIGYDSRYSAIELRFVGGNPTGTTFIEAVFPDSTGYFHFKPKYRTSASLIQLEITGYFHGYVLLDSGLHIEFKVRRKIVPVRPYDISHLTLSGADASKTRDINLVYSRLKSKNYQSQRHTLRWSLHDTTELINALTKAHLQNLEKRRKDCKKINPELCEIITNEIDGYYFMDMLLLANDPYSLLVNPSENAAFHDMLEFNPGHLSWNNSTLQSFIMTWLIHGDANGLFDQTRAILTSHYHNSTAWNDVSELLEQMHNRNNKLPYDTSRFSDLNHQYLVPLQKEIYTAQVNGVLQTKRNLPETLIASGMPNESWERAIYVEAFNPFVKSENILNTFKRILSEDAHIAKKSEQITSHNVESDLLGNRIAQDSTMSFWECPFDSISTLLSGIRETYKGEVVVIDLWATWCAPCLNDMQNSHQTKLQMDARGIKTVYLCEGAKSHKESWMGSVLRLNLSGSHIYLNRHLAKQLIDHYNFSGYPSYLVLDSKGNFHPNAVQHISGLDTDKLLRLYGDTAE